MGFLGLFEGYGIELEYMIVNQEDLMILPIADKLLSDAQGELVSDYDDGAISWSNELTLHLLEFKTNGPAKTLDSLSMEFHRSLGKASKLLKRHGARLMPTAMHPLMSPKEAKLWPHENNEIYDLYDRIFGCSGHGWCNLQSMHINLPFRNDDEFVRLHDAVRILLPILPALSASSPIVEGSMRNVKDNRLLFYQTNQSRVPSIMGSIIPEPVHSMAEYHDTVLRKIYDDISAHDPDKLLREDWLNSRGAIPRFERQSIEIRLLDLQEAPVVDIAIADLVVTTLRRLVETAGKMRARQREFPTTILKQILDATILNAEKAEIADDDYRSLWGAPGIASTASELWHWIFESVANDMRQENTDVIAQLLLQGSLSTRITSSLGSQPTKNEIISVYRSLCDCLDENRMFNS